MALFASAQKITKGVGDGRSPFPSTLGKHEMCHPFHAQQKWRVHHTFYQFDCLLFWFDFNITRTSTRGRNPHPGHQLGAFSAGDQSQPTKSLRSCLVSSWHRLSLLPFFFLTFSCWHDDEDMLLAPVQIARAPSPIRFFHQTPIKKQDFYDYYHHHFLFIYTCVQIKYVCVWLFVIALGCFIGDVYTRREADV